ncbi:T-complex protein 1 subunit theta [Sarotherodon galilaeus]
MDNFETPYEEEDIAFIECEICEKSLRGDTLYKIHLTTPGHIKKEGGLVTSGRSVRRHVPEFKDIIEYLDYLNLDEPIIGLNFLEEGPPSDRQIGPKYLCKLCNQSAVLAEMVCHVIGRKHRQKYVELKRPDLVTWDRPSVQTLGGKIMRAKAEIIERQDGRGTPKSLFKKGNESRSNSSRAFQRQRQNREQTNPQDLPPLLPELKDYHRRKHASSYPNASAFPPNEPNMNVDRRSQRENRLSNERTRDEPRRSDFREGHAYREGYMDSDYRHQYEEGYGGDSQRSLALERGDAPKYDFREELPRGLGQSDYYPEGAPPYRRAYPERESVQDFHSEDVRGGNGRSEYSPSQAMYPEGDKLRWSLEREADRHDGMNKAGRQGSSEPEARRRNFSPSMEGDRSRDNLFNIIQDYRHEMREVHQDEAVDRRAGGPASQRHVDVGRTISNIPEPFRRFLKGGAEDDVHGKRKRKSRFSDATPEEVEGTREMYGDNYGSPNPKFGGDARPGSAPMSGGQFSDLYREPQGPHHPEMNQRGGSESEGVFDMLSNIEIENAEEADFLKSKLCNLLKEFKTKKMEKAVQNSHGREGIPRNYSNMELDPRQPPFERTMRDDSHHRQSEDLDFRDWRQREHLPEERHNVYPPPAHEDSRYSKRGRFEEESGAPHTNRLDEPPYYPERFPESLPSRDYQPPVGEFFDSHSSAPPLHMEQESRMPRGPRYSNNLDKITSALLELVARK